MWWRSPRTQFYQSPNRPSITAVSCPSPGVIPSKTPADIQSFHRAQVNVFAVFNAAKQRLGLNRTKLFHSFQKSLFPVFLFAQREIIWWLSDVIMTAHHQNVSGSKKDYWAQWVPCVATFCHITSAILNVFNWDFSNPTFFQSTFYCKYSFFLVKVHVFVVTSTLHTN